MDERKTDGTREVKIYPPLLLAYAALCYGEGLVAAGILYYLRPHYSIMTGRVFDYELAAVFAVANIVFAFFALMFLNIYLFLVRITKSEDAPVRKLLIAAAPAFTIAGLALFVSGFHTVALVILIYSPVLAYSIVSGMAGKRDFNLSTILPVAFLAALVVSNIIYVRDEYLNHIYLPAFILNCFALRNIQARRKQTVSFNRKLALRVLKTTAAVGAVCVVFYSGVYSVSIYRKIHAPVRWTGFTPDWSPQGNRIVFAAFNLKTTFTLGEPTGKALIYDADARKIERVISLPGLPSRESIFDLSNIAVPAVAWTWEKDKLFYLKNGNEGVLFNADGTGFETIFKLPKNQYAPSTLLISPKRTKIYIAAIERIARPGKGMNFKIETVEHHYIADLVKKKLRPFTIKGLQPIGGGTNSDPEELISRGAFNFVLYARSLLSPPAPSSQPPFGKGCYSLLRFGYTGWFDDDVLALEMPDCAARLPNNLMEKFVWDGKNEDSSKWTPLSYAKIFVRSDGTGLGNFPTFNSSYTPMLGDGRRFIYLDNESSNTEDCFSVGDMVNKTLEKTCCIKKEKGGKFNDPHGARLNLQARAVYDASDWIWVRIYGAVSDKHHPQLINYKTCELNTYFTTSLVSSFDALAGMPSDTGEYHVLSKSKTETKSPYEEKFIEDSINYKYILDNAYFGSPGTFSMFTGKRSFSIFTAKGELAGTISEKDFAF